ncbi:hypothetical protein I317_05425 [Kwoniella heveanensis CBS 569]|nr:hypothetical protein I317_05425 [Kwoniella heveanensis CBS 569]
MSQYEAALSGLSLGHDDVTVILGGTQGIGAAVARKLASMGCSRIIIVGRGEEKGQAVVRRLKELGGDKGVQADFIKGDLSQVEGMKVTARAIAAVVGKGNLNYLVQCQNGVPTGTIELTSDGLSRGFSIQALSRFAMFYHLEALQTFSKNATIMSICNPGQDYPGLDLDDLSLEKVGEAGRWQALLLMDQSKRDSTVIDSVIKESSLRYPQYRQLHLAPGLVKSEGYQNWALPFPLSFIFPLGFAMIGRLPDEYAPVPIYAAYHPEARSALAGSLSYNDKLKPVALGTSAANAEKREKLWETLQSIFGAL